MSKMPQLTPKARAALIRLLREKLNTGELRDIVLDFGLRASNNSNLWGKLSGENDNDRVLSLVDYAGSVERVAELYEAIEEWRPDLKDRLLSLQSDPSISTNEYQPQILSPLVITAQNDAKANEYYERGVKYLAKGDHDLAIAVFSLTIELNPDFKAAYRYRAESYFNKGEYDKAIADCDKAIFLDPSFTRVYIGRATSYARKSEYDKAIADYDKAIALDPNLARAYNSRGAIFNSKGQYDEAIVDYDKAIALDPNFVRAYLNRGNSYYFKGAYDQAIADYSKAIA